MFNFSFIFLDALLQLSFHRLSSFYHQLLVGERHRGSSSIYHVSFPGPLILFQLLTFSDQASQDLFYHDEVGFVEYFICELSFTFFS